MARFEPVAISSLLSVEICERICRKKKPSFRIRVYFGTEIRRGSNGNGKSQQRRQTSAVRHFRSRSEDRRTAPFRDTGKAAKPALQTAGRAAGGARRGGFPADS